MNSEAHRTYCMCIRAKLTAGSLDLALSFSNFSNFKLVIVKGVIVQAHQKMYIFGLS